LIKAPVISSRQPRVSYIPAVFFMNSCGEEKNEVRRCGVDVKPAAAQITIEAKREVARNKVPRGPKFTSDEAKYLAYAWVERSADTS
jgi:hypothetical protein